VFSSTVRKKGLADLDVIIVPNVFIQLLSSGVMM